MDLKKKILGSQIETAKAKRELGTGYVWGETKRL